MGDDLLVERRGRLGLLTLDRPRAMNALTHEMVRALAAALEEWRHDPRVETVAIRGAGDRGLCAGGDVVGLRAAILAGDEEAAERFWRDEYALDAAIARYPKPVVALQDGVVLGGGVGISGHASHRVVTERTRIGFPEATIGFVPDVGGTWLLSRGDARLGMRLALTAESVGPADAIAIGLADRHVPSDRLDALVEALEHEAPEAVLGRLATDPGEPALVASDAFAADNPVALLDALRAGDEDERSLAETIASRAPRSVAIAHRALRAARDLPSLEAALVRELRIATHLAATPDFAEGVRAQLVDKDRTPRWAHVSVADVAAAEVDAAFVEPPGGDLVLPAPFPPAPGADHDPDRSMPRRHP